jgi:hypothetical protein
MEDTDSCTTPARADHLSELCRLTSKASKKMLERDGLVVRKNLSGQVLYVGYFAVRAGDYAALHLISMLHFPSRTKT